MTKRRRERLAESQAAMRARVALRKYQSTGECYRCECRTARFVSVDETGRETWKCRRPNCEHRFRKDPESLSWQRLPDAPPPRNGFGMRADVYEVYVRDLQPRGRKCH